MGVMVEKWSIKNEGMVEWGEMGVSELFFKPAP
jgi:hypothetical protein